MAGSLLDSLGNAVIGDGTAATGRVFLYYDTPDPLDTTNMVDEPMTLVSTSFLDSVGSFQLRANFSDLGDPSFFPTADRDSGDGYATFELLAVANGQEYHAHVVRQAVEDVSQLGNNIIYAPMWLTPDGEGPVQLNPDGPAGPSATFSTLSSGTASNSKLAGPNYCVATRTLVDTWNAPTIAGELHTAADANAVFNYGNKADSTIDTAFSYDAAAWRIDGSAHVSTTQGSADTISAGSEWGHLVTEDFHFAKYRWTYRNSAGQCARTHYTVEVKDWIPGIDWGADNSSNDHQCSTTYSQYESHYGPLSSFTRNRSSYTKFGGAVTVFGVTLGAQSGMSNYVQGHWTFGAQPDHYLCGTNDYITRAKRIFAGA